MKKGVSSAAHTRARVILSAPPPPAVRWGQKTHFFWGGGVKTYFIKIVLTLALDTMSLHTLVKLGAQIMCATQETQ